MSNSKKEKEPPAWYLMTTPSAGMSISIIYLICTHEVTLEIAVIALAVINIVTLIYAASLFHLAGYKR